MSEPGRARATAAALAALPAAVAAATGREPLRPPLKWAGGKRWLLPRLLPLYAPHRHRRLVEPLCGGLAVALGLRPERALLNDLNPHPVNFYRWLQRGLRPRLKMENDRALFEAHRRRFNELVASGRETTRAAAELFYYLNRTAYNGLCRFNSRGEFNVPFGRHATIPYASDLTSYREALGGWTFTSGPFEALPLEPDDFVYADPPYDVEFRQYSSRRFEWDDQVRLAEWLAGHPGPVALSNQATGRVVDLYTRLGFALDYLDAPRRISCTGDRTPAREVLALRNLSAPPRAA
jgi:DNA adenine methylase